MSDAKVQFAQLAVQYYAAGRYAAISHLIPVLGSLLHHAVEMALKASLSDSKTLPQLKELGHDLRKIWAQFKLLHPSAATAPFDTVVTGLQKFEELRYPDSVLERGAAMEFVLFKEHVGTTRNSTPSVPRYALVLEEIDKLETFIFRTADINPLFFTGAMSEEAKRYLMQENREASSWK